MLQETLRSRRRHFAGEPTMRRAPSFRVAHAQIAGSPAPRAKATAPVARTSRAKTSIGFSSDRAFGGRPFIYVLGTGVCSPRRGLARDSPQGRHALATSRDEGGSPWPLNPAVTKLESGPMSDFAQRIRDARSAPRPIFGPAPRPIFGPAPHPQLASAPPPAEVRAGE